MMERSWELKARFAEEPYAKTLGATLDTCVGGLAMVVVDSIADHLCIVGDVAQGGVTTSLADYAAVYAAMSLIPEGHTPCKHIHISLLRPVMKGESLVARGEVMNVSRTEILVHAEVYAVTNREKPKALATLTFAKPRSSREKTS